MFVTSLAFKEYSVNIFTEWNANKTRTFLSATVVVRVFRLVIRMHLSLHKETLNKGAYIRSFYPQQAFKLALGIIRQHKMNN